MPYISRLKSRVSRTVARKRESNTPHLGILAGEPRREPAPLLENQSAARAARRRSRPQGAACRIESETVSLTQSLDRVLAGWGHPAVRRPSIGCFGRPKRCRREKCATENYRSDRNDRRRPQRRTRCTHWCRLLLPAPRTLRWSCSGCQSRALRCTIFPARPHSGLGRSQSLQGHVGTVRGLPQRRESPTPGTAAPLYIARASSRGASSGRRAQAGVLTRANHSFPFRCASHISLRSGRSQDEPVLQPGTSASRRRATARVTQRKRNIRPYINSQF
eukprot:SAG31_NODE_2340_length_5920_cov_4.296561_3_plen_276_part_00